jgi:hypothetical protein
MLPERQKAAYEKFYAAARHNNVLDARTTLLIHIASALAFGCYP